VVVTSDHGELLGERGLFSHPGTFYEELIKVPLLLFPLPEARRRRVETPVTTRDILPTLLDVAGIGPGGYDFLGRSLLPLIRQEQEPVPLPDAMFIDGAPHKDFQRAAIIKDGVKYWLDEEKEEEHLYKLEEDPGERTNLVGEQEWWEEKEELKKELKSHLAGLEGPVDSGEPSDEEPDTALRERLEGLGYLD